MKKLISFFVAASFLMASCGESASLWGEYATPTPLGGIPTSSPVPAILPTQTPTAILPVAVKGASTATPTSTVSAAFVTQEVVSLNDITAPSSDRPTILYYAQSGDWLPAVANRFGVDVSKITSPKILPEKGLLDPGTLLIIPDTLDKTLQYTSPLQLIPDDEVIFSSTALDFDIANYVSDAGGYLSTFREYLGSTGWMTGADEIDRLAYENSINPRLLLAILDYELRWVRGGPESNSRIDYPLGFESYRFKGMFMQMVWGINQIATGYYDWRAGTINKITFSDGTDYYLDPTLNAGTVGLMYYFAHSHSLNEWLRIMDPTSGFSSYYQSMFGDPWARAQASGPIFPPGISQPEMSLPFENHASWAFTGGPHSAWERDGPWAAVDFAPASAKSGCEASDRWVVAASPGLVVRSGNGVVMVDMDGDGSEQTGWDILYLHVAAKDRVAKGQWVEMNDHIGHPSCEGGVATGTHLHFARKYNGEWVTAGGPIPFVLSGWTVFEGDKPYEGKMVKDDKVITADVYGQARALIVREDDAD